MEKKREGEEKERLILDYGSKEPKYSSNSVHNICHKRTNLPAPLKAILWSVFLFSLGSICIITASLIVSGHINPAYYDRVFPLFAIGFLTFIPGFYFTRVSYHSWRGTPGFSYKLFPYYQNPYEHKE